MFLYQYYFGLPILFSTFKKQKVNYAISATFAKILKIKKFQNYELFMNFVINQPNDHTFLRILHH